MPWLAKAWGSALPPRVRTEATADRLVRRIRRSDPGAGQVGYAKDAMRFMGATFDPSALYRFNHVRRMLAENGLDTPAIPPTWWTIQAQLLDAIGASALGQAGA